MALLYRLSLTAKKQAQKSAKLTVTNVQAPKAKPIVLPPLLPEPLPLLDEDLPA
jgi:hypothetical protein